MSDEIKVMKKKEPVIERLSLPVTKSLFERYKKLSYELDRRELTKLHDLTRSKLNELLDQVERQLDIVA